MISHLTFARTFDYDLVRAVITSPAIYPHVGDDFAPRPEEYEPLADPRVWWVTADNGGELVALFLFVPHTRVCWECHVSVLPGMRGRGIRAGRGVIPWIFAQTGGRRLVADIPATNPAAIAYAQACGFRVFGRNEKAFQKNGVLVDLVCLGLSKE